MPKAAEPEILIMRTCHGHWVTVGRTSRRPHLAKAPRAPPKKTANMCLLFTLHDVSGETSEYCAHYVDLGNATTAISMRQYRGGRI